MLAHTREAYSYYDYADHARIYHTRQPLYMPHAAAISRMDIFSMLMEKRFDSVYVRISRHAHTGVHNYIYTSSRRG